MYSGNCLGIHVKTLKKHTFTELLFSLVFEVVCNTLPFTCHNNCHTQLKQQFCTNGYPQVPERILLFEFLYKCPVVRYFYVEFRPVMSKIISYCVCFYFISTISCNPVPLFVTTHSTSSFVLVLNELCPLTCNFNKLCPLTCNLMCYVP